MQAAKSSWSNAYNIIKRAVQNIDGSSQTLYIELFGKKNSEVQEPWKSVLSDMKLAMETASYTIELYGDDCDPVTYAYTYFGSDTLYMCDVYIDAENTGYDSKMGIVVHNLSHVVADTYNYEFGRFNYKWLADT